MTVSEWWGRGAWRRAGNDRPWVWVWLGFVFAAGAAASAVWFLTADTYTWRSVLWHGYDVVFGPLITVAAWKTARYGNVDVLISRSRWMTSAARRTILAVLSGYVAVFAVIFVTHPNWATALVAGVWGLWLSWWWRAGPVEDEITAFES